MKKNLIALALLATGCGGGGSGGSATQPEQTPSTPTGVSITSQENEATISWNAVAGVDGYHVYYSTDPAFDPDIYASYPNSAWLRNVSSPLTISGLGSGPVYYFVVTAYKGSKESNESSTVSAVTRYRYTGSNGEIVTDQLSRLDWKRCVIGMTWNNAFNRCDGISSILNSNESLAYAAPDSNGWRLPTIEELQSIMYFCVETPVHLDFCNQDAPFIYQPAFPNTPFSRSYFSSDQLEGYPDVYLKLGFSSGGVTGTPVSPSTQSFVRLVRTAATP